MIVVYCRHCFTAVRVLGEEDEVSSLVGQRSEFWPDHFKCVRCDGNCEGDLELNIEPSFLGQLKLMELTAQELFASQMGLGLAAERSCDLETVRGLFLSRKLTRITGKEVRGTTRCILECFYFEDGTRLYIGASPHGAVVYRIAKPFVEKEPENG